MGHRRCWSKPGIQKKNRQKLLSSFKKNIIKTIFVALAIVSFNYAETFPPSTDTYHVVAETKVENTYIYVCESISENKVQYENVWQEEII